MVSVRPVDSVVEQAQGMFLLVQLTMDGLFGLYLNPAELPSQTRIIYTGSDGRLETYNQLLASRAS